MWYAAPPSNTKETDDEFRDRVMYCAGDTDDARRRIRIADGRKLDDLAAEWELRRR